MWNIMKAQLYQLKRNKVVIAVFLLLLFAQFTAVMGEINYSDGRVTADSYLESNAPYIVMYGVMFLFVLIGYICGADFMDKTSNYELMAGHSRKEVYLARVIPCILIGIAGEILLMAFPVIVAAMQGGWGNQLELKGVILRLLLLIFPIGRMICEMIFVTFLIKNAYFAMAGGFFVFLSGVSLAEMTPTGNSFLLSVTNFNMLCSFETWTTYSLINGSEIVTYSSAMDASAVIATIIFSFMFGAVSLVMGYIFFKNDDLN